RAGWIAPAGARVARDFEEALLLSIARVLAQEIPNGLANGMDARLDEGTQVRGVWRMPGKHLAEKRARALDDLLAHRRHREERERRGERHRDGARWDPLRSNCAPDD